MKHSKALDHLLVAVASLQEGNAEEAEEALTEALEAEDLDETLAELSEMQDEALEQETAEADEDVQEAVEEALEDEEGVEVAHVRGRLIVTMAGVRNARQAKRVFKSLASVDDVEDLDPEEYDLDGEEAVQATIDGEEVVVSFDEDGTAEVMQVEDNEVESAKHGSGFKRSGAPMPRDKKVKHKSEASTDEEFDSWDEDDEYFETARVRRSRQAARRRNRTTASRAKRTLAGLNLNRIARNRNSL